MRSSFLNRLSGKEFFVFETTFSLQLIEVLALIMPQSETELFENEILQTVSATNLEFVKKYAFAFVVECQQYKSTAGDSVRLAIQKNSG